jgi:hypothetical protein
VVVVVVATTPNYLRQASQNLGKYMCIYTLKLFLAKVVALLRNLFSYHARASWGDRHETA